ncbi:MAG: LamG domain-containing protein [Myxococcota bacterium]|nr:LamG domain-containing protein [Myxococcota bacterium]
MKTSPLFLIALLPFFGGCNKDQTDDSVETGNDTGETGSDTGEKGENTVQTLLFSNPTDGSFFAPGETLSVEADVAGNYTVSELEVALRVDADIITDYSFDAGSLSFDYTVGVGEQLTILEITDDTQTHRAEVTWIGNTAPTLQLDDPGEVSQGEPLTLTGMVDDGETAPEDLVVTWYFDGEEIAADGPLSDGSISLTIDEAPAGSHLVEVTVADEWVEVSDQLAIDAQCTLASSIQTLLHLNEESGEEIVDSSLNQATVSLVGGATIEPGVDGNAINFNGESYLTIDEPVYPPLWATNFTIGGWVKPNAAATSTETIFQQTDGSGLARTMLYRTPSCGGALASYVGAATLCGTTALQENTWQHVAITRNRDTGKVALFLNGIKEAEGDRFMEFADGGLVVGAGKTLTNQFFNGAVDEVMVLSEAMEESDLTALVAGGPPICKPECSDLPTSPYHWFDGTAGTNTDLEDLIGNTNASLVGATSFGPGTTGDGLVLDGATAYAELVSEDTLQLSSTDFTISLRARFDGDDLTSEDKTLVQLLDGTGLGRTMIYVDASCGGQISSFIGGQELCSGSLSLGFWHHIVLRVDQTNGTAQFFVDGLPQQTANRTMVASDGGIRVGTGKTLNGQFWDGVIDDIMIYDTLLSDDEIIALHESGTNYCPQP